MSVVEPGKIEAAPASSGFAYGLSAYLIWGFLPLYFHLLASVAAPEIVAHRILWSVVLLVGVLALQRRIRSWLSLLRDPRVLRPMLLSASLILVNWLTYIWAVNAGHVVATSLGYFLNPLVNVVLGMVVLKERLTRAQMIAVGFAATGVAVLALASPGGLWISLTLALSFGVYGLVRKMAPIGSLEGLASETLILLPLMLAYLGWLLAAGTLAFGDQPLRDTLLIAGGLVTSVPLLLFASAARRLPYSVLGLLQYLAPTIQFLLGIFYFGETLTPARIVCFALIWTGLAVFTVDTLLAQRRRLAA